MAQTLYPDARIVVKPFEEVQIPNKSMDLIVGNPPFAEIKIFDPDYFHSEAEYPQLLHCEIAR